ncbi:type VII secretion protein EccB [Mycobacterium talmoniae]|uniref:Type VII secretion protein EccB n=1 Tax=Mycobacterium talmoniae TaxID=1858794 RepID=A0A1S1MXC1_9MYCO|nr:type VII secretion protein EccB [Mycobacterium talmoniae]OHU90510.1 type VII secretion protein EccB [Mycobacterium talmoniae]
MAAVKDDRSQVVSKQHPPSKRLTTKIQFSGAIFIRRRLEHAIVRRNTQMWDDPMRFYSRASTAGLAITALIAGVCLLMAFLKPQGNPGNAELLADATNGQLFVLDQNVLRPVLNLTSARLIIGRDHNPRRVKSSELARHRRGQLAGIPGAPWDTPTAAAGDGSYWSVCDTVSHPASTRPTVEVSVLAEQPTYGPDTTTALAVGQTILATYHSQNMLIDHTGRHAIDLTNTAITTAINLPPNHATTPLSAALYNALPAADPIALPEIPDAGQPNTIGLDPTITVGTVIANSTNPDKQHYVVLADGIAPINQATAAALRNTNTYGHLDPPTAPADKITAAPPRTYPSPLQPVTVIDRATNPVLCWDWSKTGAETTSPQITIAAGKQIPLSERQRVAHVKQITTDLTVYQAGGGKTGTEPTGRYVHVINPTGNPENQFYIDSGGVRYGLPDIKDAEHLGLHNPQLAPWPAIRLLAAGPDLTQANALLEHDTLPTDPTPRAIPTN